MQKCVLQDELRGLQYSRTERKTKPCNKYDAPAETHGTWHGISTDSKGEKDTFDSPAEALAMPVPSSKKSRRARVCNRLRNVDAHAEQKGSKIQDTP